MKASSFTLALGTALLALAGAGHAGVSASSRYCEPEAPLSAEQKDKLFRFGAVIKAELEASGLPVALVARSGLDLDRFDQRYSHAGLSLKSSGESPWAVRQLYFACDERRPLLYDQGFAAFLLGSREPDVGYVSVVFLPAEAAATVEAAALDKRVALQLLNHTYSANAYPFSLAYQNCNQWVLELLATAWGGLQGEAAPRAPAQRWLKERGYAPTVFQLPWQPMMWLGAFVPWIHADDHPDEDKRQARYRVSMPESIEAFVRQTQPGATRVEFCHTATRVVVHRGWDRVGEGCVAGPGDTEIALD